MEFLKRPVAPYFVAVPEFDGLPPADQSVRPVSQPPLMHGQAPANARSRLTQQVASHPPSPRIATVVALEEPTLAELADFLGDPDPAVGRTAVAALSEHVPSGYESVLFAALADDDAAVRRTAADGVRELVEVVADPATAGARLDSSDPVVRACVVYLLSSRRVGDPARYRAALADPDHRVRIEAVRALVSVDDASAVTTAADDTNREVRIAVANACATLRSGAETVRQLIGDPDPQVRAAALAALGEIGCGDDDVAVVEPALGESAWQVRVGAARALGGSHAAMAVPRLSLALDDPHLDVRKAAVLGLTRWAGSDVAARDALSIAVKDSDADVRAYARRALQEAESRA
jgi:HEAT repeat protein